MCNPATPSKYRATAVNVFLYAALIPGLLLNTAICRASVRSPGIDELQTEVALLQERVASLEQQLQKVLELVGNDSVPQASGRNHPQAPVLAATPAIIDSTDGSAYTFVTSIDNSAVSVGGRIKLDAIYNSHSTGGGSGTNSGDLEFFPAAIPVMTGGEDDQVSVNARQTRLWLKGYSPGTNGPMAGYIEIDFDSATGASNEKVSNSFVPRLRHAYGTLGGLTLGQTYTTFMNISAYPEINDLNGPAGIIHIRQPLIQYRSDRDWGSLAVALENPESTLLTAMGSHIAPDDDRLPDGVGKVEFTGGWGNWSLSGLIRQIRSDGAVLTNHTDSVWGGAISASGRIMLTGRNNLRFNLAYGNALGRYLSFNAFDDGVIDTDGRIKLTPIVGGYFAYQHWWTDDLRSTASIGIAHADHAPTPAAADANNIFYSTHLNLIWSPTLNASLGIEWLHAYRELEDGRNGELDRIQLTSLYRF